MHMGTPKQPVHVQLTITDYASDRPEPAAPVGHVLLRRIGIANKADIQTHVHVQTKTSVREPRPDQDRGHGAATPKPGAGCPVEGSYSAVKGFITTEQIIEMIDKQFLGVA